ncbi:hypothetical protein OVA14_02755 [Agrococcus sp. SL85]|uniref:hypothetical protein n=1 Tax=Agrococcus sp. SL85 TaxID=2995141 RepID=UPI00226D2EC0|nr:hypothetical protein [Agrococcus sp. SL85]WAC66715.1 hypothetical protein OVA14_02755 [Agrococcus sp. SL85]
MLTSGTERAATAAPTVTIGPDPERWLVLPPLGRPADAWVDASLALLQHHDGFEAGAYRGMLEHALALRSADDAWTLQWWPATTVANVVVHVVARELAEGEAAPSIVGSVPFLGEPAIDLVDHVDLGRGIEVRGAIASDVAGVARLGLVAHAFCDGRRWIGVVAEPTLPALATQLLHDLRLLARSLRIDGAEWRGARLEALPEAARVERIAAQEQWHAEAGA